MAQGQIRMQLVSLRHSCAIMNHANRDTPPLQPAGNVATVFVAWFCGDSACDYPTAVLPREGTRCRSIRGLEAVGSGQRRV